jgi:hypothetical protein
VRNKIIIFLDCPEEYKKYAVYALEVIFDILGIAFHVADSPRQKNIDIYYGSDDSAYKRFPLLIPYDYGNEKSAPQLKYIRETPVLFFCSPSDSSHNNSASTFLFDIISSVYYLLSGMGEKGCLRDVYDRPRDQETFSGRMGILGKPLVNMYCALLKKSLLRIGKKEGDFLPLWPENKRYAVALSHDVDLPEKYISSWRLLRRWIGDMRFKTLLTAGTLLKNMLLKPVRLSPDPYWNFEKWIQLEKRGGFFSTFFFASANIFSPDSSVFDPIYTIEGKKYSEIMHQLTDKGWSIGLHASYDCWKRWQNFEIQKQELEKISQQKIIGVRNHYYRLNPEAPEQTLEYQRKAGFIYDSSLSFNDAIGFRRGIALPFNPFVSKSHKTIDILEIAATLGDEALFLNKPEPDEALDTALHHLQEVKKYNGLAVLNWHCRSLDQHDYPYWGKIYTEILDYLLAENEAWVTSLDNIALWWKERRKRIKDKEE